jgi:hypothetical protein
MTYRELRDMFEGFGEGHGTILIAEPEEPDFDPLEGAWAAAELEAADALHEWRMRPGADAYAIYRAAADRASAAQDALRGAAEA